MSDSLQVNNDVKKLTRYAMGLTPEEPKYSIDPSVTVWTIGMEKGIRGVMEYAPELKDIKKFSETQKTLNPKVGGKPTLNDINRFNRMTEIHSLESRFKPTPAPQAPASTDPKAIKQYQKALREYQKSSRYDNVRKLINDAKKLDGKAYTEKIKEIHKAIADADLKVHNDIKNGAINTVTKRGKALKAVKKYTGYTAAKGGVKTALTKSAALRGAAKFCRGNAVAAASIDAVLSIPEIMQTKAQLGTEAAVRQTGRVATVIGAQVGGYAAGAWAGGKLGAAVGTAIGGPIGTVVGGVIGVGVGLIASYFTGKVAQEIVGQSELDQHAAKVANAATQDAEIFADVAVAAKERYDAENNSELAEMTEDTKQVADIINSIYPEQEQIQDNLVQESTQTAQAPAAAPAQTQSPTQTAQATQAKQVAAPAQETVAQATQTQTTTTTENTNDEELQDAINQLEAILKMLESFSTTSYSQPMMPYNTAFTNPYMMGMNFTPNYMFTA